MQVVFNSASEQNYPRAKLAQVRHRENPRVSSHFIATLTCWWNFCKTVFHDLSFKLHNRRSSEMFLCKSVLQPGNIYHLSRPAHMTFLAAVVCLAWWVYMGSHFGSSCHHSSPVLFPATGTQCQNEECYL